MSAFNPQVAGTEKVDGARDDRARRVARSRGRLIVVCVALYGLMSLTMLTRFPRVWMDTAWTMIAPYTLVEEGRLANPMRPFHSFDQNLLGPEIGQRLMLAAVYEVFGFGLLQSRLLSALAGLLLLISTYWFSNRYLGRNVATLASFFLAVDGVLFVTSRDVRADIFVALLALTGFFLFVHGNEVKSARHSALAGVLVGLSLFTHPNSVLVLAAIVVCSLTVYRKGMLRNPRLWAFCGGAVVAFSPYAVYVVAKDWSHGFGNFFGQLGDSALLEKRVFPDVYLLEVRRYVSYILFPKRILIFGVQVAGVIYAFFRPNRVVSCLLIMVLSFATLLPLWNPLNATPRYFIMIVPVLAIFSAMMLAGTSEKTPQFGTRRWRRFLQRGWVTRSLLVGLFLLNQVTGNVYVLWEHRTCDYERLTDQLREVIPRGSRVWGTVSFWIGLKDHPYRSQLTPVDDVIRFRPEYVILFDTDLWGNRSATVRRVVDFKKDWSLLRQRMESLCRDQGRVIGRIDDEFYGDLEVCHIYWGPYDAERAGGV